MNYDYFYTECMYNVRNECGELVLRHLNDMNEADFREACKYGLGGASGLSYWLNQFKLVENRPNLKDMEGQARKTTKVLVRDGLKLMHYTFAPECLKYLLSKGFDVFELIPQGKAVYMYDY